MAVSKVIELNLENGNPTVETAITTLKNALSTYKRQGYKAAIIIHGYGSSGVGGAIKPAVRKILGETSLSGLVRSVAYGEQWSFKKKEILTLCPALSDYERRLSGNAGVTVVILKA